jgi:lipid II:glycine glycyltransferase (peptidoglycan interpeptide bridge formation enzyme)
MSHKAKYLSSLKLQKQLPIFFQPWWLDIVSKDWDILLDAEEDTKAVFPICRENKIGLKLFRNPLLTPYLGPLFLDATEDEKGKFQELWKQLPKWDSFHLETTTSFLNAALFEEKGFEIQFKDTYILNLEQDTDKLFSNIHTNHRNLIRQANAVHQLQEGPEHIPILLSLHKETFTRKNKPYPFDTSIIETLIQESTKKNNGCLLSASDAQQNITASIFVVWDHKTMYLLLSTFNAAKAHQGAVRMLIWEAIKKAKALNLSFFDFEGSMDPGIAAFFRRFGGERKTYLCASRTDSLLWNLKKKLLG